MITYSLSIARQLAEGQLRPRVADPLTFVDWETRAYPWRCDYLMHVNNARYFLLMDYGRTRYFAENRLLGAMREHKYKALVAGSAITYRRSIELMDSFTLRTRVAHFDEKWFVFEQVFVDHTGRDAVRALVRGRMYSGDTPVSIGELFAHAGISTESPEPTDEIKRLDDFARVSVAELA